MPRIVIAAVTLLLMFVVIYHFVFEQLIGKAHELWWLETVLLPCVFIIADELNVVFWFESSQ